MKKAQQVKQGRILEYIEKYLWSGCGADGRVVTSDTSDPQFKSQHRQKFIGYLCNIEKTKIKKKRGPRSSMDSVLASHPGSIVGVPEGNLFPRCCRDYLTTALLSTWTVQKLNNVDQTTTKKRKKRPWWAHLKNLTTNVNMGQSEGSS